MKYTFGDGNQAAQRLGRISRYFNPPAQALIKRYLSFSVQTALDLACGPGFSTAMLAEATGGAEVIGLDRSCDFLSLARIAIPHCKFIQHDVTTFPFPVKADVMYARFILSHLPQRISLVKSWLSQIRPGGLLVLDETESVATTTPVFRTYLDMNQALIASAGGRLFVGEELRCADFGVPVLHNSRDKHPVPDREAASWFLPNACTVWRNDPFVANRMNTAERRAVVKELEHLAASENDDSTICWYMRRIVLHVK